METAAEPVETVDEEPRPVRVSVPLAECSLAEARALVKDASFFTETRLSVLFHFPQISLDDYWGLTVADHAAICVFLRDKGLL